MVKMLFSTFALLLFLSVAGCETVGSLLNPYEDDFACLDPWGGSCSDVQSAYNQSISNKPTPRPIGRDDDGNMIYGFPQLGNENSISLSSQFNKPDSNSAERDYRQSVYKKLQKQLQDPPTPVISPPKVMRVYILPYASQSEQDVLYMPRFIYFIVEDPKWVIGDYLVKD